MPRATLTQAENFRLCSLIEKEYQSSGLGDTDFALYAVKTLDLLKINRAHIEERRKIFGLPNNAQKRKAAAAEKLQESLDAALKMIVNLEKAVGALEQRIKTCEFWIAMGRT